MMKMTSIAGLSQMNETLKDLIAYRDYCNQQAENLIERYGTGVRPSWVGVDLAITIHNRNRAQEEIDKLEAKQ